MGRADQAHTDFDGNEDELESWRPENRSKRKKTRDPSVGHSGSGWEHPAKFAVKVGVLRWEPDYRLGNRRVFVCPIIASAGQDLDFACFQPGVHPISIEL